MTYLSMACHSNDGKRERERERFIANFLTTTDPRFPSKRKNLLVSTNYKLLFVRLLLERYLPNQQKKKRKENTYVYIDYKS